MTTRTVLLSLLSLLSLSACVDKGGDSAGAGSGSADGADGGGNDGGDGGDSGVDCVDGLAILSGVYTTDVTIGPSVCENFLLEGPVFIGESGSGVVNSNTLTIEPGTTIYGDSGTKALLAIQRGAKIMAQGTAAAPIIFTSANNDGERARSDWGGLILNGQAPINNCWTPDGGEDSACEVEAEGDAGLYGGSNAADNSGVLEYVRIEFGGIEFSPDNEVNGLALQGVGSGTTLSYIQVHRNKDDGIEFFGGTVNVDHLVLTGSGDDSLDWTDGWQGSASHVCIEQTADLGDRGIEADNREGEHNAAPRSGPTLSNFSIKGQGTDRVGLTLRRGTGVTMSGMAVGGFDKGCLDVDDVETLEQITSASMSSSVLGCGDKSFVKDDGEVGDGDLEGLWNGGGNDVVDSITWDGWQPQGFDSQGCLAGGADWTAGWTTSAEN